MAGDTNSRLRRCSARGLRLNTGMLPVRGRTGSGGSAQQHIAKNGTEAKRSAATPPRKAPTTNVALQSSISAQQQEHSGLPAHSLNPNYTDEASPIKQECSSVE